MAKKKQNINHWLQTFGKAEGSRVLKEIKEYARYEDNTDSIQVHHGKQQMYQFILDRIKAASGKSETYASIIYEMELL